MAVLRLHELERRCARTAVRRTHASALGWPRAKDVRVPPPSRRVVPTRVPGGLSKIKQLSVDFFMEMSIKMRALMGAWGGVRQQPDLNSHALAHSVLLPQVSHLSSRSSIEEGRRRGRRSARTKQRNCVGIPATRREGAARRVALRLAAIGSPRSRLAARTIAHWDHERKVRERRT